MTDDSQKQLRKEKSVRASTTEKNYKFINVALKKVPRRPRRFRRPWEEKINAYTDLKYKLLIIM